MGSSGKEVAGGGGGVADSQEVGRVGQSYLCMKARAHVLC